MVPMRDGLPLATDVFLPPGPGPFPVILLRTPYGKKHSLDLARDGLKHGYAVVLQDTRGRAASGGENLAFEADGWYKQWDGYNTLEWLAKQPWCNGKIGTVGDSAKAVTQLGMAGTGTGRLTAQSIYFGSLTLYNDFVFPGGIYKKSSVEDWNEATHHGAQTLKMWQSHPTYDAYWKARDLSRRWDKVNAAAVYVGGWYDPYIQGMINTFVNVQKFGGPKARGHQKLIIGPFTHSLLSDHAGELKFPNAPAPPTPVFDSWKWFDYTLKGLHNGVEKAPPVVYYVMGASADPHAPGNTWRTAKTWPPVPTVPTPYYLQPDRALSTQTPHAGKAFTYAYDPKNPVPTTGGAHLTQSFGAIEQHKILNRPDVLSFTSEPLKAPLELTGRVHARLYISSDAPDTDFFVKLCDVYPDGHSYNICEGALRARFRNGFDREDFLIPGQIVPLDIDLYSTSIVYNKGHRLQVIVTSSDSPGFDPNPNTGTPFRANDQTRIAHNTVYCDARHPTQILLPVAMPTSGKDNTP